VFLAARAAVQALAGNNEVTAGLGVVLFLIGTGTAAAAEYDEEVQSRGIRRRDLDILPVLREFAYLYCQGGQVDLGVTGAAELERNFNLGPACRVL